MTMCGCRILTVCGKDHRLLTAIFERLQRLLCDVRSAVVTEENSTTVEKIETIPEPTRSV